MTIGLTFTAYPSTWRSGLWLFDPSGDMLTSFCLAPDFGLGKPQQRNRDGHHHIDGNANDLERLLHWERARQWSVADLWCGRYECVKRVCLRLYKARLLHDQQLATHAW
jgi:hypothetical protein